MSLPDLPNLPDLNDAMEPTWPAAATHRLGPWLLREGADGGKRVSAASALGDVGPGDLARAEAAMADMGQVPLFVIRPTDQALDILLDRAGYHMLDPVLIYSAPCAPLAALPLPGLAAFPHWPPLEIARSIWAEAGIGPARMAVMDRVSLPKTVLLGRVANRSGGAAFVAANHGVAFLHGLEVRPALRRMGLGRHMMIAAARWAATMDCTDLALAVTTANLAARQLYTSLGMAVAGQYHYRQR